MKIFRISQKNPALSIAEIKTYFSVIKTHNSFVLVDAAGTYEFLAYTKEVYSVLFSCSAGELLATLQKYDWNKKIKGSFCVRSEHQEKELAGILWHALKNPSVDLETPDVCIHFFYFGTTIYCGLQEWKNPHTFLQRKAHVRPEFYPASLDPQLALAMVNLSCGKKIVDPFCGTGGILIEGALTGRQMSGYDISTWMLEKCKKNIDYYSLKIPLYVGDATTFVEKCDAIVTELPFGKNTKSQDMVKLYTTFLENAKKNTKKMVVSFPDFIHYNKLLKQTGWTIEHDFAVYVHKSLTKHVVVLWR